MTLEKLSSFVYRLFFIAAFGLLIVACVERSANALGYTIVRSAFSAGRLLDYASILMIFVIALLLRETRQILRR